MRSDFRALAFCLSVAFGILVLLIVLRGTESPDSTAAENVTADSTATAAADNGRDDYDVPAVRKTLKAFDPNTADAATLSGLGLAPWMVKGILRYRSKGGVYSSVEDFARVPGLTKGQYRELLPYITISDDLRPASELVGERRYGSGSHVATSRDSVRRADVPPRQEKMEGSERLSVNDADTTALKRVPGIGSYFARRIVEMRQRLGGFVSLGQLLDIKGFPESALEYLVVPDGGVRKVNVNTADFKTLASHPLIGYKRAKSVTDYRRLKGRIQGMSQLAMLAGYTDDEALLVAEYVEF